MYHFLSEDEVAFQAAVRDFAEGQIKPLVSQNGPKSRNGPRARQTIFRNGLDGNRIS